MSLRVLSLVKGNLTFYLNFPVRMELLHPTESYQRKEWSPMPDSQKPTPLSCPGGKGRQCHPTI